MDFAILAGLAPDVRRSLLDRARRRTFGRREVVVHEGDPADSLHLIHSGRLAARVSRSSGHVATLGVMGPGDHFGEIALLDAERRRTATVVALEPAETWSITAPVFHALRAEHPAVGDVVLVALAHRVDALSRRLVEVMYEGIDRRLYAQLVDLCTVYAGPDARGPVTIPLTQEVLAELVGGTRPTVNAVLQRLAERGLVRLTRGRVVAVDVPALARLVR